MNDEIRQELVSTAEEFERLLYDVQSNIQRVIEILNKLEDKYGRR